MILRLFIGYSAIFPKEKCNDLPLFAYASPFRLRHNLRHAKTFFKKIHPCGSNYNTDTYACYIYHFSLQILQSSARKVFCAEDFCTPIIYIERFFERLRCWRAQCGWFDVVVVVNFNLSERGRMLIAAQCCLCCYIFKIFYYLCSRFTSKVWNKADLLLAFNAVNDV